MYVLLSTVVAPTFDSSFIVVERLTKEDFLMLLPEIEQNFCGHPVTWEVLKAYVPGLINPVRGQFWDGKGVGLAARPKGGVRGGTGDVDVTIDDLEFCKFWLLNHNPIDS